MNQSAPNLVKIYMTIRSLMSLIMGVILQEQLELFAFAFEKLQYFSLCLHCSIYKYQPISSRLGQNMYDSKILDKFNQELFGQITLEFENFLE